MRHNPSSRELNHKLTRPVLDAPTVCGRRRDFNNQDQRLRPHSAQAAPEAVGMARSGRRSYARPAPPRTGVDA